MGRRERSLTVEMFLLRSDHLLGGGFAYGLSESLSGNAVPGGEQPVVYRLSGHGYANRAGSVALVLSPLYLPARSSSVHLPVSALTRRVPLSRASARAHTPFLFWSQLPLREFPPARTLSSVNKTLQRKHPLSLSLSRNSCRRSSGLSSSDR